MSNQKPKRLHPQYEPVDPKLNLPSEEEKVLKWWEEEKVFERSVTERPKDKSYVFFEGPPTANGKPGIHHVLGRTFKDAIPRYQTMRGFRVERKAGWDTHGLPVELQVEKQLGISGKPQIESLVPGDTKESIAKFNQACRESVWQFKDEWEKLTRRMGFWLDLDHPYVTYENDYIESVWSLLKKIWNRELLDQDFKVVPYCPRCGTALSSHEVALGYEETTDQAVYVKFPVIGQDKTYLIAWTTTPWTLPGNLALAIGKDIKYGIFTDRESGERYILADSRKNAVLGEKEFDHESISVEQLIKYSYEPLFDVKNLISDKSYKVYPADFVSTEDGSGIVHTAVMYGEDDFKLGNEIGLPKHHTVDLEGKFTADVPGLAGKFVKEKDTEDTIVKSLEDRNLLLNKGDYTHTYPFCWRCSTPLIYYAKESWFIRMSSLRQELLERNEAINWVPEHLKEGRFGEWLREVKDWALSRDRYWGTPLPIWKCDQCDHKFCAGSKEELAEVSGLELPEDLHKPFIDEVKFSCEQCDGEMSRYSEVIDVWFDSGAMPFAQWHYPFENQEDFQRNYPADYIAEGIDQTRGWFYTLLAIATAISSEEEPLSTPYRNVITHGLVLDKAGKKMSKSKGNVVDPWVVINSQGIDPLRFYFYSVNQPIDNKKFDLAEIEQVTRKVFLIIWNTYSFLASRVGESEIAEIPGKTNVLDRWLVARTNKLIAETTVALESYDLFSASRGIGEYITQLSTWYLRLSRKREDADFLPTLAWALKKLALMLAPFSPFFAELLWSRLHGEREPISVHLASWPVAEEVGSEIITEMSLVEKIVEEGRAKRALAKIKVRQPLKRAAIHQLRGLDNDLIDLVKSELNVHHVDFFADGGEFRVELDTELTNELKAEGLARDVTRTIQGLRKKVGLNISDQAKIMISGDHPLKSLLEKHLSEIETQTKSKISWQEGEGESAQVESLTVVIHG